MRSYAPETKSIDLPIGANYTDTVCKTDGVFTLLNGIQLGTGFFNRIGNKIRMKSIQLESHFICTTNSAPATATRDYAIRIMIIYDRQPNGAVPTIANILSNYDQNGAAWPYASDKFVWCQTNPNFRDRFLIVRDCKQNFGGNDPTSTNVIISELNNGFVDGSQCRLFKKLKGLETVYNGTASPVTETSINSGALWLLVLGGVPNASAPISFRWNARLRFWDG